MVVVTFKAPIGPAAGTAEAPSRHQVGTKWALSGHQVTVLAAAVDAQPVAALIELCGRTDRTKFRNQVLRPLLEAGLLEMTVPDTPRSSRQRYRTTAAGTAALKAADSRESQT